MRGDYDHTSGTIIGGDSPSYKGRLYNTANGELVAESGRFDTEREVSQWAKDIIAQRKATWGHDYAKRYPKGFDLKYYN